MSKNLFRTTFSSLKHLSEQQNQLINSKAFAFLPRCLGSKFDMTSAEPLHPGSTGIMPPSKVLKIMREEERFDDLTEFKGASRGEESTLEECVKFFNSRGIKCGQNNVSLSNNILSAIENVYAKIGLNYSGRILVTTPTFGCYFEQFESKRISFSTIKTRAEEGFLPNPEKLEDAIIKSNSTALLLCYPNNPTGVVMTRECAQAISDITKRHNVFVISDEAFMNNSLSQKQHFPIAAIEGMLDRSFTITGAAKSMFIGRKIGFCVGNSEVVNDFRRNGGYPTKRDQRIMTAAIEESEENTEYHEKSRNYYLKNIVLIKEKLRELNQKFCEQFGEEKIYVKPFVSDPDATNVYLLDFSGLRGKRHGEKIMETGLDAAKWLLEEASVGTVPGECFLFDEREMLVRIALNHTPKEITQAFDSMMQAASKIQSPSISAASTSATKLAADLSLSNKAAGL